MTIPPLAKAAILLIRTLLIRNAFLTLVTAALLAASSAASAAAPLPNPAPITQREALQMQVGDWAQALAVEPGFESFAAADIELMPLGPGTHGWLALLKSSNDAQAVGYMVVHALENGGGYQLSEYGLGEYHLFAEQTLHQGLARLELHERYDKKPLQVERLYPNAFLAAWRIIDPDDPNAVAVYLDAKTGEQLPIDDEGWAAQIRELELADDTIATMLPRNVVSTFLADTFDAYERMPWLTRKPLALNGPADASARLQAGDELRLTSEWFHEQYMHVLPLTAVQHWNDGTAYMAVDQEGLRFLPYPLIERYAMIYD